MDGLRAWAMAEDGTVLDDRRSDLGSAALDAAGFEPALRALVWDWQLPSPCLVLACGSVGARHGWAEAPYARVPCSPLGDGLTIAPAGDGLDLRIVGGLGQDKPADVMRGEETLIAGYLAGRPDFDGVVCLPGDQTRWAHVSAGEVVSFQTAMTGELFALLASESILRLTLEPGGRDDPAFDAAVGETMSRPEALASRMFALRAEGLLNAMPPETASARLMGLLLGAELAASRPYWLGREVALVGEGDAMRLYARALEGQGVQVTVVPPDPLITAGLTAARARLKGAA
ncbi:2-dehydro-3-deoxygalactonokinase [Mesobaculum littorinae]|uniref:2-dehydro-3-deoxygalactonokinase n=2 Tax=Mesobaculum littorinae TaxID=2486419 RepID=A0A438AKB8_9RHOB|nr:2-dehydro-3-deoxygalactonokinase [Mesobaculum littorinae]